MRRFLLFGLVTLLSTTLWGTTHTVTILAGDDSAGSFRKLLSIAAAGDTIEFGDLEGIIDISADAAVSKSVTVIGNGKITVTSTSGKKLFSLTATAGHTSVSRLHFQGGQFSKSGGGNLDVHSCIFSHTSTQTTGGAIYVTGGGSINIRGCTFFQNMAKTGGGIYVRYSTTSVNLTGNVFYENTATDGGSTVYQYSGTATSAGYNVWDKSSHNFEFGGNDIQVSTPVIAPVSFRPLQNSPAAGALPPTLPEGYPLVDFYGNVIAGGGAAGAVQGQASIGYILTFPEGLSCSAAPYDAALYAADGLYPEEAAITLSDQTPGAYEWIWTLNGATVVGTDNSTLSFTLTGHTAVTLTTRATIMVTSTADSGPGSLRAALSAAADGDRIQVSTDLSGDTILLASSLGGIARKISLEGNGITIDGAGRHQILKTAADISISNVHFTNGTAYADNQGEDGGGAISHVSGTLSLTGCTFSNNRLRTYQALGGAIFNKATLKLEGCTFTDNVSFYGGAIFNKGSVILKGNTFTGNRALASVEGNVIYNGNTATSEGGNHYDADSYDFTFGTGDTYEPPPAVTEPNYGEPVLVISGANEGEGTLRAALTDINKPVLIRFEGVDTVFLTAALPTIGGTVRIEGRGTVIAAQGTFLPLTIVSGAEVYFSGLQFTGAAPSVIHNNGRLTLRSCILNDNAGSSFGAIYNTYYLNIAGCTFYKTRGRTIHSNGILMGAGNLFYGNTGGEGAHAYDNTAIEIHSSSGIPRMYHTRHSKYLYSYGNGFGNNIVMDNGHFWGMMLDTLTNRPLPAADNAERFYLPFDTVSFIPLAAAAEAFNDPLLPDGASPLLFEAGALANCPLTELRDFPTTDYYGHPRNLAGLTSAGAAIRTAHIAFYNGDLLVSDTLIEAGASLAKAAAPAAPTGNHSFLGWFTSPETAVGGTTAETPLTFPCAFADSTTLYARWEVKSEEPEPEPGNTGGGNSGGSGSGGGGSSGGGGGGGSSTATYRVAFSDGTDILYQTTIRRGSLIPVDIIPETTPPEGMQLLGWYVFPDNSVLWDFDTDLVAAPVTLFPLWTPLTPDDGDGDDDGKGDEDDGEDENGDGDGGGGDALLPAPEALDPAGYKTTYYTITGIRLSPRPELLTPAGYPAGLNPGIYLKVLTHPLLPNPQVEKLLIP